MKHLLKILILSFITHAGIAQDLREEEVPKVVRDSFNTHYPNTFVYEWEWKKKQNLYKAEFKLKAKEHDIYFSPEGVWVKTEIDISLDELPPSVNKAFKNSAYADWKPDDIEEHTYADDSILYEIEVKKDKQKVYLYFDMAGELKETIKKKPK